MRPAKALLADWVDAAARLLHSAGTLTLIWRADGLAEVLAALDGRFGGVAVLPVHGRAGQPAIRVLVRARKGSRAPLALLPGLMLNDEDGQADRGGRSGAARRARRCRWLAINQHAPRAPEVGRAVARRQQDRRHQEAQETGFSCSSPVAGVRRQRAAESARSGNLPAMC